MTRMNRDARFQPRVEPLEDRLAPALTLAAANGDLTLTGTPTATTSLTLQNVGGDTWKVTDGSTDLGTYHVTRNVKLRLDSIDNNVVVDLAGQNLTGNVAIDVGSGDRDPSTPSSIKLTSSAAGGKVAGDVTFNGGSGKETWALGGTLEVVGNVRATSTPVTTPIEDSFLEDKGVTVDGNLTTTRLTYTTIAGTVDGNVNAQAIDSPGGMGLTILGTIHGNLRASGGATVPGFTSYAVLDTRATVDGNVNIDVTDDSGSPGSSPVIPGSYTTFDIGATIGHDLRLHVDEFTNVQGLTVNLHPDIGGSAFLILNAAPSTFTGVEVTRNIGGNLNVTSQGGMFEMDLFAGFGPSTIGGNLTLHRNGGGYVSMQGTAITGSASLDVLGGSPTTFNGVDDSAQVGGDLKVHMDQGGFLSMQYASVGGSARVDLGQATGLTNGFSLWDSTVGGSLNVSSDASLYFGLGGDDFLPSSIGGDATVRSGDGDDNLSIGGIVTIAGDLSLHLGGGNNNLGIDGTFGAPTVGGAVRVWSGAGADTINIAGSNTFRLIAHTGGGDDTVAFAPDARVASALIDFGDQPGNKSWVPPTVIDFPLVLKNYP